MLCIYGMKRVSQVDAPTLDSEPGTLDPFFSQFCFAAMTNETKALTELMREAPEERECFRERERSVHQY